jgi:hypothetical protein
MAEELAAFERFRAAGGGAAGGLISRMILPRLTGLN